MNTATRREALEVLAEICELDRDVRLGQLMSWFSDMSLDLFDQAMPDVEDGQFLAVMKAHRDNLRARAGAMVAPPLQLPDAASMPINLPN